MESKFVKGYYTTYDINRVPRGDLPFARIGFLNRSEAVRYLYQSDLDTMKDMLDEEPEYEPDTEREQRSTKYTHDDMLRISRELQKIGAEKRRRTRQVKRLLKLY